MAAYACSGAAALIYEVTWTRGLSLVLGSTVYALSTMLAAFMLGLALGASLGGRMVDGRENTLYLLGVVEIGIGLSGMVSVPLIYKLPLVYTYVYWATHMHPAVFYIVQVAVCALVMLIPTVLMGATFPLVNRYLVSDLDRVGVVSGNLYSANTLGALMGSLAGGFLLIPALGVRGAIFCAVGINIVVGLSLLLVSGHHRRSGAALVAMIALSLGAYTTAFARPASSLINFYNLYAKVPLDGLKRSRIEQLLDEDSWDYYKEDLEGPVRAKRMADGTLLVQVGAKIEGTGWGDLANAHLLAYLPLATHPGARDFLNIGLGAGVTVEAAKGHVERLSVVEINAAVFEAVERLGPPGSLQGIEQIRGDARNYLLRARHRFDVISSEPSYPTESPVTNLFTVDFYRIAATRLRAGGIFCQWLPYYYLTDTDVRLAVRTFASVFPYFHLWKVPGSMDLILVGSQSPLRRSPEQVREGVQRLNTGNLRLDYVLSRTEASLGAEILAEPDLSLNTDDHPLLEFDVVRNILRGDLR